MAKDGKINWTVIISPGIYLLYKLRWVILIIIIILIVAIVHTKTDMDDKYQKYGYNGLMDNIHYDEYTGEIIFKSQIDTYDNSNKSFTNSKGKSVTLGTIKDLENQYESIQKSYMFVTADRKDSLDSICNKLLRECLDVDYELVHKNSNNFDYYVFVVKGEFKKSYYSEVDSTSKLKGLVREVLKTKYFKDVNMKDNGIE